MVKLVPAGYREQLRIPVVVASQTSVVASQTSAVASQTSAVASQTSAVAN
jgi:hypothetical protein